MAKTAIEHVRATIIPTLDESKKVGVRFAIARYRHPIERTQQFHRFYNAPVCYSKPNRRMDHMSDERHAFRLGFILSEAFEILEKGFGVRVSLNLEDGFHEGEAVFLQPDDEMFLKALAQSIKRSENRNAVEVIDGLGDLNVVVNGYALELGVDMDEVDAEVAASNFTKPDENGNPIVNQCTEGCSDPSDCRTHHLIDPKQPVGKVLKGPNFMKPNMEQFVQEDSE